MPLSAISHSTKIKICGLTRLEDVQAAVAAGADAIGFVFYEGSPRYVNPQQAATLMQGVPPFVSTVGLLVNADVHQIQQILALAPVQLLQFHGDESVEDCVALAAAVQRPFMRAYRVKVTTTADDLLECEARYRAASPLFRGLLLDTYVDSFGGSGKVFDWSLIPKELAPRVVLSGGLSVQNATDAVRQVRPFALDISSGVEIAKGIKEAAKIQAFIAAVGLADQTQ